MLNKLLIAIFTPFITATNISRYGVYGYILVGIVCVCLCGVTALFLGVIPISINNVFNGQSTFEQHILIELRLPRVLLALCVGAILAICGCITQGLFRNPLADPSIIGVSAGASAGASIVIVLFSEQASYLGGLSLVFFGAFTGSVLAVFLVYRLATTSAGTSVTTLLLAGIALTFFAGSLASFLQYLGDNDMLKRLSLWRMGGFDHANYTHVALAFSMLLILCAVLPRFIKALNAFLLGESQAFYLGIPVKNTKRLLIICVAAGVGLSVALAGTIAFVGLIVPHIVRLCVGADHRLVLPISACLGACLLIMTDTLARTVLQPEEIPVGLITSFIGAPIFMWLLKTHHHKVVDP